MIVTLAVAALLVASCCTIHLLVLRRLKRVVDQPQLFRRPMLLIIFVLFLLHLFEVTLYALALSALDRAGYGRLIGAVVGGPGWFEDHFHFSIASYTTLGIGDIIAEGPIRIIAGIEALNGLVLVAWSASFTYIAMERLWQSGEKS
jgi:hypothetical protein